MINAKEAAELVRSSGVEADRFIDINVAAMVERAAGKGLRSVFIFVGSLKSYSPLPTCTPVELQVIDKLKALGYDVDLVKDNANTYIPPALQNDDGTGPVYCNYGFCVKW